MLNILFCPLITLSKAHCVKTYRCVIRFLILLEKSLISVHAYPITTVMHSVVCMTPVHILHLPLTEVCDIHIHNYKCLSSVVRVIVPCWFTFDTLRSPQVSCLWYQGWIQVLLSRLDSISVFLILVIFCHGIIIRPFLGTLRFKSITDFSGLPQMSSVSSEDLSCQCFYDI